MISRYFEQLVQAVPTLEKISLKLSRAIHNMILAGGEPARQVADFLHGTWLGHPLHPAMTDVPIGSWTAAIFFDGVAVSKRSREAEQTADALTIFGTVMAVPTAIAGIVDYSVVRRPAASAATMHAVSNQLALGLYLLSIRNRRRGDRSRALVYSTAAFLVILFGAWLGSHLVYKQRVQVDFTEAPSFPEEWMTIADENILLDGAAQRIEVKGYPVLLYRSQGTFYAVSAVCAHEGGPLEKGKFDGVRVQCPWHDSVFDLRDGKNVHGPAVYPLPSFDTRVRNGRVQIRLKAEQPRGPGRTIDQAPGDNR